MTGTRDTAQGGPATARHLVGDVQRFGLLSAATVVDRYIGLVAGAMADGSRAQAGPAPDEADLGWLVLGAARLGEASLRLLDVTAALVANGAGQGTAAPGTEELVLPSARPGSSTEASVYVHNPTPSPAADVALHATSLVSSDGSSVPMGAVSFLPGAVDVLASETSREVRLRVDVPADQPAGEYLGLVLSSAVPSEPITLRLQVQAPAVNGS